MLLSARKIWRSEIVIYFVIVKAAKRNGLTLIFKSLADSLIKHKNVAHFFSFFNKKSYVTEMAHVDWPHKLKFF